MCRVGRSRSGRAGFVPNGCSPPDVAGFGSAAFSDELNENPIEAGFDSAVFSDVLKEKPPPLLNRGLGASIVGAEPNDDF